MMDRAIIGLASTVLQDEERARMLAHPPRGVILFRRNVESPTQLKRLIREVKKCAGEDVWIVIDEEGGRVHRIPWPPFNERKSSVYYGELAERDENRAFEEVYRDAHRTGQALASLGFTHNCAPVLDLVLQGAHPIIGERAYSSHANIAARLGEACMLGLQHAGIQAVGKHFPGHGRADADSHVALPKVEQSLEQILQEAFPFAHCIQCGLNHVMTAHVLYPHVDQKIATFSPFWLKEILRQRLGFRGYIWSDDLCMAAAGGDVARAAFQAIHAGCDVLLISQPDAVARFSKACSKGAC